MSNNIQIEGNLPRDAKLGFTKKGNAYAMFSIGDTPKGKDGVKPLTTWWNCACWDIDSATADKLRKGTRVKIEGWAVTEEWLSKEGEKKQGLKVTAKTVQIVSEGKKVEDDQPF